MATPVGGRIALEARPEMERSYARDEPMEVPEEMPLLTNSKHEQFAQLVAKGASATKAYVSAGYSKAGADASASRLLRNARVCSRIEELKAAICERVIAREISRRTARVDQLQDVLDRIRVIVEERAVDMVDVPGGGSGLLFRDFKGKDAGTPVYRFDAAIVNKLNETLRQAAQEMGQWGEKPAGGDGTDNKLEVRVVFVDPPKQP